MSLLPPNSTKSERNIAEAIDYKGNADALAGFKFNEIGASTILDWEYSLAQINIDDFQERILKGLEFHRIRGTPASLRNALSWYGFTDIIIEEEPPGEHFAEFQIGLTEIPNDLVVDQLISVSQMAAPLRSRLTRMYNDEYDIRRFILDASIWGDILSDNSGTRLTPDSPVSSFGRTNKYSLQVPEVLARFYNFRWHMDFAANNDTYKLDWTILDESPNHTLNNDFSRNPLRYIFNRDSVCDLLMHIFKTQKIAKALMALSEDSEFGDINGCLSGGYEKYDDTPFILSFSALSEHQVKKENVLISERKYRYNSAHAINESEPCSHQSTKESFISITLVVNDISVILLCYREYVFDIVHYRGNDTWHDHRHFDVAWDKQSNCSRITPN